MARATGFVINKKNSNLFCYACGASVHTCTEVINSLGGAGIPWFVIYTDEIIAWFGTLIDLKLGD